jgi:NifU-like protein involved in Fe-S cluster formation
MPSTEPIGELYTKRVLSLAADIPRLGRLAKPDASARCVSRLCGSEVTVDLCVKDGVVTDFAHEVKACALGQAASSVMARNIVGSSTREVRRVALQMHAMLKQGGPAPGGEKWADLAALELVRDYKPRHTSTLLTFEAVVKCLDEIEGRPATLATNPRPEA